MNEHTSHLVRMRGIHKFFGKVHALRGVDFDVGHSEVVGLIGDNGAGKSTLIKILAGVSRWDRGEVYIRGQKMNKKKYSIEEARKNGIEAVYQEKALAEKQRLWRNVFMGREISGRLNFLRVAEMRDETEKLMKTYIGFTSLAVTPDSIVSKLSGGEKEGVAIARGLFFRADLVILDEPTMALSVSEVEKVLSFVKKIKGEGKSCIFITHNIYHVYPVADRFVILDRGRNIAEFKKEDMTLEELIGKLSTIAKTGKLSQIEHILNIDKKGLSS